MSARRQIHAAIFDMDGLLIDSEPLWDKAELEVMASLGVDIRRRNEMPDILGLRIDLVVDLWFAQQPWQGPDRAEVGSSIALSNWWKRRVRCCRGRGKRWRCVKHRD